MTINVIAPTIGTLESLRETLKQTMEEKNKFEAKVLEDRTRLETRIAELKKVVSDYTAELQSIGNTLETLQPDTKSEHLSRTQVDYQQIHAKSTAITVEDVLAALEQRSPKPALSISDIFKKAWNGWVLLFLFFLFSIWMLFSWLPPPKTERSSVGFTEISLPSLMPTAEACVLFDRMRERRALQEPVPNIYEFPSMLIGTPLPPAVLTDEGGEIEAAEEETVQEQPEQTTQEQAPVRQLWRPLRALFRAFAEGRAA